MRTHLHTLLILSLGVTPLWAGQDKLPDNAKLHLREYVEKNDRDQLLNATTTDVIGAYIFERAVRELQPDRFSVGSLREDLQLGTMSGRTASTSILARPGISELLSAALESGAIGRKADDTSATFSVNALPLKQLLSGQIPRGCGSMDEDCFKGVGRWLRGLSVSATFDTSNPVTATPAAAESPAPATPPDEPVFLVGNKKLTAIALRYELFVRERDSARAQATLDETAKKLQDAAKEFLTTQVTFSTSLTKLMEASDWKKDTLRALENAGTSLPTLEAILLDRYQLLYELMKSKPEIAELHAATFPKKLAYITAQNKLLAEKLYRKALTFDYVHERPSQQPELHQLRAVFSTPLGRKPPDPKLAASTAPTGALTVNAGVSLFRPELATSDEWKVRDSQVSMGLDWTPNPAGSFRPTYTLAYYFQYMVANGVLKFDAKELTPGGAAIELPKPAKELLDTKGPIHIVQFRISLPAAEGVTFPLAVSYSNRSELIKGRSFWQGHAGVAYDFSGLKKLIGRS